LSLAVRPSIELGVRIGTKVGKQGLVLGLEPLALHGCGWLTLKAKSLDQRREAALMTIAVSGGMGKLMYKIPKTLTGSSMTGLIRISWVWSAEARADQCSPTARFLADRALLLGKPQATRMLAGSG